MLKVKFNKIEEFLAELEDNGPMVAAGDDPIVRVTLLYRYGEGLCTHVSVVATYARKGNIIRLDKSVGALWETNPDLQTDKDKEVMERAAKWRDQITEVATSLGYQARAGIYGE